MAASIEEPLYIANVQHKSKSPMSASSLRDLPSVDSLASDAEVLLAGAQFAHEIRVAVARDIVDEARRRAIAGNGLDPKAITADTVARLQALSTPSQRRVINATGIILHTNLGRAPLAATAVQAMAEAAAGYTNLEVDLSSGARGSRQDHLSPVWRHLLGSESAVVVNNNASAVLLALASLCRGGEVIVSRGEAVEIGGGFRIPEILRISGAKLVEVGTTNRTRSSDYAAAVSAKTRAILRVHPSNFRIVGFTEKPTLEELSDLARMHDILLIDDVGSGALLDTTRYGLAGEPRPQDSLSAGADIVMFSTDKLFGGPQGGVIAGSSEILGKIMSNPLARTVRTDKVHLAGVEATARLYLENDPATKIPIWSMISATADDLGLRAEGWKTALEGDVVASRSAVGGGSLPGETLPTYCLALPKTRTSVTDLSRRLRKSDPPIMGRIEEDRILLDPRTVRESEDADLVAAVSQCLHSGKRGEGRRR